MSNEILYILLPDFASHEMVYLMEAVSSDEMQLKSNPKYINKVVSTHHGASHCHRRLPCVARLFY